MFNVVVLTATVKIALMVNRAVLVLLMRDATWRVRVCALCFSFERGTRCMSARSFWVYWRGTSSTSFTVRVLMLCYVCLFVCFAFILQSRVAIYRRLYSFEPGQLLWSAVLHVFHCSILALVRLSLLFVVRHVWIFLLVITYTHKHTHTYTHIHTQNDINAW